MRSSYDLSTVVPESRRITYGGDSCSSDVMESCSKGSVDGDAAVLSIGDTGMGIFFMVPRAGCIVMLNGHAGTWWKGLMNGIGLIS